MHLFPDADEDLSTIYPDYPLANVLVCFGIILVLSIDQIAIPLWRRLHPIQGKQNVDSSLPDRRNGHRILIVHSSSQPGKSVASQDHHHDHDHLQRRNIPKESLTDVMKNMAI